MKVAFLLCICSLQISAEVLSNITIGRNLLLETPDSIESSQSLETTSVPLELVHNNGQRVYGSTIDDDYDDDVEGLADVANEEDDLEDNPGDDPRDNQEQIQLVNVDAMRFLLFADPDECEKYERILYGQDNSLRSSGFDPSKPTKILIHGFRGKHNGAFPTNVKEAYLKTKLANDYNVIVLDWKPLALPASKYFFKPIRYAKAVRNVKTVAERLAAFVTWLNEDFDVNLDQVHLIGHSLGAHVAGNAGHMVIQRLGHPVGRITGLDPAGPTFSPSFTRRLHDTDAQYVDVIHTNGGMLGIYKDIGHADFWLNTGAGPQPGCENVNSTKQLGQIFSGTCSHRMASVLYANTIRNHEDFEHCTVLAAPFSACFGGEKNAVIEKSSLGSSVQLEREEPFT